MNKACFVAPSAIILGTPEIGKGTWIGYFTIIDGSQGLTIGKNCSIASGVHIYTHSTHELTTLNKPKLIGKVKIGDNVAIGANSIIHYGCQIGNHAIIGSLSMLKPETVVNPYEYWHGNPAKKVKTYKTRHR